MKKILSLLLTLILALALLCTNAFATQENTQTPPATAAPSDLPPMKTTVYCGNNKNTYICEDTDVTLKFEFSPRGETFTEDFVITKIENTARANAFYDVNETFTAGDTSKAIEKGIYIPSAKIGEKVDLNIYWHYASTPHDVTYDTVAIEVVAPNPKLTIEAVVDSTSAAPGSLVKVEYRVTNVGNVLVNDIYVIDTAVTDIDGNIFTPNSELQINGYITKIANILLEDEIVLNPTVVYSYNGQQYESTGEQVTLVSEEIMPEISLVCDNYMVAQKGANHTFNYHISNTSSVKILNIRVYNGDGENATLWETIESLDISQSISGSFEVPIEKSGFYKFKVVYTYESADTDKVVSIKSAKSLKLPNEVYLQVEKVTPEYISEPGKIAFTLLVENSTNYELRNLIITEESGLIDRIALSNTIVPAMAGGKPGEYRYTVEVEIPADKTTVKFNLNYSANDEYSTINTSYYVSFISASASPSTSPITPPPNNDNNDKNSLLWIVLVIIFLLIILALIIVLIILKNKNSRKNAPTSNRKMRSTFNDDYDDYDEEDYDHDEEGYYVEDVQIEELPVESLDEEIANEFDDEFDDEGVKIYKSKK